MCGFMQSDRCQYDENDLDEYPKEDPGDHCWKRSWGLTFTVIQPGYGMKLRDIQSIV